MEALAYKVIRSLKQYKEYCNILEDLVQVKARTQIHQDTIDLLNLLVQKWDEAHNTFAEADPIEILGFLMKENKMRAIDLAGQLEISKSLVSDILHYRRGLSKDIIRKLAARFKVSQELFNKPYKLVSPGKSHSRNARVMSAKKKISNY